MEGRKLLHYRILGKIGEGGMGVVYKARDEKLGRLVAIKVLPAGAPGDDSSRARFFREARAASALNHPSIITIHEITSAEGTEMIVMEFVSGRTLAEIIGGRGLPVDQILDYGVQMADALAKAHGAGVIHRDVKPRNVMVTDDSLVKVLDFGLAKLHEDPSGGGTDLETRTAALTAAHVVMGTAAYMSPEQAAGEPLDPRTDVFSLGVVLYEMTTGRRPFAGKTTSELLGQLLGHEPPDVAQLRPETPPALRAVLRRALAKRREDRFTSMSELRDAMRAAARESARAADVPDGAMETPTTTMASSSRASAGTVVVEQPQANAGQPHPERRWGWIVAAGVLVAAVAAVSMWGPFFEPVPGDTARITGPSSTPFEHYEAGRVLLDRHDRVDNVDKSIAEFEDAVRKDDEYAPGYAGLADAYHRKNLLNPDPQWLLQARNAATRAVALNPYLAITRVSLGKVQLAEGLLDEAEAELQSALDLNPQEASAHMALGAVYQARADDDNAEASYRQAIAFAPDAWQPLAELGQFLYKAARYDEAAEAWEQSAALVSDNATVHRVLGAAYYALDRFDDAASEFQRSLEIEPSASLYNNLGTLRFFQGKYAESAEAFEHAVEMRANVYQYWGSLGDAYRWSPGQRDLAADKYQRAVQLAREALVATPDDIDLRSRIAVYLAKGGDPAGAVEELKTVEQAESRSASSLFRALVVYELAGERAQALAALEQALKAGYSAVEIRNEPELVELRTDPQFHTIMSRVGQSGGLIAGLVKETCRCRASTRSI